MHLPVYGSSLHGMMLNLLQLKTRLQRMMYLEQKYMHPLFEQLVLDMR